MRLDRSVGCGHRIAARHEAGAMAGDDAMGEEPALANEDDDVADMGALGGTGAHEEDVAGTDGGKHARALHAQPQAAGGSNERGGKLYELRRLVLHDAWVALILPQASAIVSNTRSWRKAGFTYGRLPCAGTASVPSFLSRSAMRPRYLS
jgi:hypothetical protein